VEDTVEKVATLTDQNAQQQALTRRLDMAGAVLMMGDVDMATWLGLPSPTPPQPFDVPRNGVDAC